MTGDVSDSLHQSLNPVFSVVSEVAVPSFIVVDLSIDGYFLPRGAMETEQHFLDFLDGILDGSIQVRPSDRRTAAET